MVCHTPANYFDQKMREVMPADGIFNMFTRSNE